MIVTIIVENGGPCSMVYVEDHAIHVAPGDPATGEDAGRTPG